VSLLSRPAIWTFTRRIVAADETCSLAPDLTEEDARARRMHGLADG
jgi:hypothetical protein